MKQIEISKFSTTCLAVLDQVARTRQPVRVTRHGEPIARIVPPTPSAAGCWLGSMKGSVTIHGDIVAPALESPVVRHPPGTSAGSWSPPVSDAAGWRDLSHQAIHTAARDELEPRLGKGVADRVETAERTDHDVD